MEQPQLTSRVVDLFLELCAIPSPPGQERAVADRITRELDAIGLEWDEDGCGPRIGSTAGNVLCRVPGNVDGGGDFGAHAVGSMISAGRQRMDLITRRTSAWAMTTAG